VKSLLSNDLPVFVVCVQYSVDGDALYCAGHAPMRDGRIFFFGGGRYADISSGFEREWGLDYARIFDPATRVWSLIPSARHVH
jgi:hypothetical protein